MRIKFFACVGGSWWFAAHNGRGMSTGGSYRIYRFCVSSSMSTYGTFGLRCHETINFFVYTTARSPSLPTSSAETDEKTASGKTGRGPCNINFFSFFINCLATNLHFHVICVLLIFFFFFAIHQHKAGLFFITENTAWDRVFVESCL